MFVMQHHQLSWEDALHMVQNRRYCISPNGGFLTQIKVCVYFGAVEGRLDQLLVRVPCASGGPFVHKT